MDTSYWLSKAAAAEAEIELIQQRWQEDKRRMERQIADLERELLEANCRAQTTGVTNESIQ